MSDENQIAIPRPFIDLFIPKGSMKPSEPRAVIAERYELCEDMAQMLKARHQWAEMGKQSGGFDHTINRDFVLIENAQPFRGNVRRHVCAIRYGTTWLLEGLTR